jgi:SAM-dependent methyltransferase
MSTADDDLAMNQRAWDIVAPKFAGGCALPDWGPFGEGRGLDLLGPVGGATVLEVGCGSGHSIARVVEWGAARVYGIDFSATQIALASELNRAAIDAGRVHLIQSRMEQPLAIRDVDVIFSIHALGWTRDAAATLRNLASYLKPGGRLVWSGGHPLFDKLVYEDGKMVLRGSYFEQRAKFSGPWCGSEGVIMQSRTISAWFRYMTDAGFMVREFLELEGEVFPESASDPTRYYSRVKAQAVPCTVVFVCEKSSR